MKTTLLIAILTLGLLPGLSQQAEAQQRHHGNQVYISGYQRCGTPIYRVRYVSGYTHCGRAIWSSRALTRHERSRYQRAYRPQYRSSNSYSGYGRTRVTYSTSSGRGYSYTYRSPRSCRW